MAADRGNGVDEVVTLRPPRNRVEPRAVGYWLANELITVLVPVVILGVLALSIPPARWGLLLAMWIVLAAGLPYAIVVPFWRYRVHRWEVTEDAVYTRTGWLWQEWRVAPMSRIQTVDTSCGPLEQLFRLASVTVTTASSAGALRIPGLDHELAAGLVERLTETTQANRGDAT